MDLLQELKAIPIMLCLLQVGPVCPIRGQLQGQQHQMHLAAGIQWLSSTRA